MRNYIWYEMIVTPVHHFHQLLGFKTLLCYHGYSLVSSTIHTVDLSGSSCFIESSTYAGSRVTSKHSVFSTSASGRMSNSTSTYGTPEPKLTVSSSAGPVQSSPLVAGFKSGDSTIFMSTNANGYYQDRKILSPCTDKCLGLYQW